MCTCTCMCVYVRVCHVNVFGHARQTNANNSLEQYETAWPLLSVKDGAAEIMLPDLAAAAVRDSVSFTFGFVV